jgi:hypothetical protein
VLNDWAREDSGKAIRLVDVSGIHPRPKGGREMSDQEREQFAEEKDQFSEENDVEAHKRRALADEPAKQEDDESDDVEAHRRRA